MVVLMNLKKITANLFIGLILLLSVIQLTLAASAIEATKQVEQVSLCPRETGLFTDVVKNMDSKAREFTVTIKGSASAWATIIPNGFVLLPGESKTIYVYATPLKDSIPSTYDLAVSVTSVGETKEIAHKVVVKKCYGSTLSGAESVQRACPNEAAKYDMTLSNNGEYKESFVLEADGQIKDRVTLSDRLVVLEKGETKKVVAYVKAPNQDGSYSFNVKSTGQIGGTLESFNAVINVDPCYAFSVDIQGNNSYSMCERTLLSIPIKVENKGTIQNTYDLKLEGPEWVRLDKNQFVLEAGEKEFVTMVVAPTYGVEGNFNVKFSGIPQKGDLKAYSEFGFSVRKCHSVKAEFLQQNVVVCNGLSNLFDAVVTNDGELRKQYAVDFEAENWIKSKDLENSRLFALNPGEQKQFSFLASPGEDVNESSYPVNFKVVAVDDSKVSVFANTQAYVNNLAPKSCYKPSISTQFENITVYADSSITMPLVIKNEGLAKVTYEVLLSGTASNFVKLVPAVLEVDSGKTETSYLYIAPTPHLALGVYDALISLKLKDGSFLITRKIPITITNDKSLATQLAPSGDIPAVVLAEDKGSSRVDRLKAWFSRNFGLAKEDTTEVSGIDEEIAEAQAEVNTLDTQQEIAVDEETNAVEEQTDAADEGVVVVQDAPQGSLKEKINAYKYYILTGIIVLLLLIILIRVDFFKKMNDFFSDDDE